MEETFLALLTAQLVANFASRTNWVRQFQAKLTRLGLRMATTATLFVLLTGAPSFMLLLPLVLIQGAMDAHEIYDTSDTFWAFVFNQLVRIGITALVAASRAIAKSW